MSQVESPFHAIAAQALDDSPEVEVNGGAAGSTGHDSRDQERDSLKAATSDCHTENGKNEAAEKNRSAEDGEEETAGRPERKASVGVSSEGGADLGDTVTKKSKKRTNVWTKTTSRKNAKKSSVKNSGARPPDKDDNVLLKPFHEEDDPAYPILLSKTYKAEKIELSADRLAASGSKGYRMVRATRGVVEGAWFFEIYVERLGDTGHTRLGWSTRKGDIQAPVGYDVHSYAYRDLDGSKVHAARREEYGQPYFEKDVIGFYINLPREAGFTRKVEDEIVGYKGQPYTIVADEPLKALPGSEIIFFKNGVCQGVAFRDINDGSYFPASSMYTHPSQDCCKVVFNFGPEFKYPANDLGDRPCPSPMCDASGPGEARADVFPTALDDAVGGSADNVGGKQRMAPDRPNFEEMDDTNAPTVAENVPKGDERDLVVKKKEKPPKLLVGINTPTLSKNPKPGESRLNQDYKREPNHREALKGSNEEGITRSGLSGLQEKKKGTSEERFESIGLPSQKLAKRLITRDEAPIFPSQKSGKKRTFAEGLGSLSMQSQKGAKNDMSGGMASAVPPGQKGSKKDIIGVGSSGFPMQKAAKRDSTVEKLGLIGPPTQKRVKNNMPVTRVLNAASKDSSLQVVTTVKGAKKDVSGTGDASLKGIVKNMMGTGMPSFKGSKKDGYGGELQSPKGSSKDVILPLVQVNKRDFTASGLPNQQGTMKGMVGTGLLKCKGSKMDTSGTGLSIPKRITSNSTGAGPTMKVTKQDTAGIGSTLKSGKKDVIGIQSVPKLTKKDVMGVQSISKPSKKDFTGSGFRSTGLDSSMRMSRTSWAENIRGEDVDVVVVESSTPYQDSPYR